VEGSGCSWMALLTPSNALLYRTKGTPDLWFQSLLT
jgi:hypothetical protein